MIPLPLLGGIIEAVGKVADDLITTDKERMAAQLEAAKVEAGLLQGQIDVNKAEAGSSSLFVAGWRPYVGWVCGTALALVYIPKAVVMTAIWTYQAYVIISLWDGLAPLQPLPVYPDLGVTDLIGLLCSMLGLAALRTREKEKQVA